MKKVTVLILLFFFSCIALRSQPCALPTSLFPKDTIVVCTGSNYVLDAPVIAGATYTWSMPEASGSSVSLNVDGKYWLQLSDGTCSVTDTVTVLFNSFLLAPPANTIRLCKGSAMHPVQEPGQQLLWYPGPIGGPASSIAPTPPTADTGRITYWVSQTLQGCETPRTALLVRVIDKPMFELGQAFIIPCNSFGITLQIIPEEDTRYTWSNGSHESSIIADTRGTYSLYAQNSCGNHRDTVVGVECQDKCVQFPNAFTPNSDGKNDVYAAACFCPVPRYKLIIFDRNGEQVFHTTDPHQGWTGFYHGKMQPSGAFVFYAEYFDFVLQQNRVEKGTLVLLH